MNPQDSISGFPARSFLLYALTIMSMRLLLNLMESLLRGDRAVVGRGDHLPQRLGRHIADAVNAGPGSFHIVVDPDITTLVQNPQILRNSVHGSAPMYGNTALVSSFISCPS